MDGDDSGAGGSAYSCVGTAHWVQFVLDDAAQAALGQRQAVAHLTVALPGYAHDSGPLSDDVRRSLLEDLELGARDAAA